MRPAFALFAPLALATFLVPAVAFGAEPSAAERALRLSEEGVEFYKAHDYRRAVEKYATAYELDPDPNLLYNEGKCYEALGDYPAAKDKYNEFLSKPNGDVNARKKASDFVAKFNAGSFGAAPGRPAARPAMVAMGEGGSGSGSGSALRPLGFGLLGAGVIGAAAGGYFFFKGRSALEDIKKTSGYGEGSNPEAVAPMHEADAQKKIDDGSRQRTLGGILLGAGAGVAAVGVAFLVVAPKRAPAPNAALNVTPLPGGGYATFGATF